MTSLTFAILRPSEIASHDRGGGARTTPLVVPSLGATRFINGITEFAPGAEIPFHRHNCEESVMLLSGQAWLDIGDAVYELNTLDTTFIPPDVPHRFRNKSQIAPMKILWIYASTEATRTLVETGETRFIAHESARN